MKIYGIYHVNSSDSSTFYETVSSDIHKLQSDGQEVEVQYQVSNNEYFVVYNALIIGRK